MAMENSDALSDNDIPDEWHGGEHGGESDLIVECLNGKIVDLQADNYKQGKFSTSVADEITV